MAKSLLRRFPYAHAVLRKSWRSVSFQRFPKETPRVANVNFDPMLGSDVPATVYYQRARIYPVAGIPVLKLYYQRMKIRAVAGKGRSSIKVVLPENENPSSRRSGHSSTKIVLPENENPSGRQERPFQCQSRTTRHPVMACLACRTLGDPSAINSKRMR